MIIACQNLLTSSTTLEFERKNLRNFYQPTIYITLGLIFNITLWSNYILDEHPLYMKEISMYLNAQNVV